MSRHTPGSPPSTVRVARLDLVRRLMAVETPVVWLATGPGYGKSCLLQEAAAAFSGTVLVLTTAGPALDGTALLQQIGHRLGVPQPYGGRPRALSREALGERTRRALVAAGPGVLVVDDVERLLDADGQAALGDLIAAAPTGWRFWVAGRRDPQADGTVLGFARTALTLWQEADLALTPEEIGQWVAAATGCLPTIQDTHDLQRATDGWALALDRWLQACRPASGGPLVPWAADDAGRALAPDLRQRLDGLTPAWRQVVLSLSVPTTLDADRCARLIPTVDGAAVLQRLVDHHLFVQALGNGHWRFHPLCHATLRTLACETLPAVDVRRLVDACLTDASDTAAITILAGCGYESEALTCLQSQVEPLIRQGAGGRLDDLLDGFSPTARTHPAWRLLQAVRLRQRGAFDEALTLLVRVAEAGDPVLAGMAMALRAAIGGDRAQVDEYAWAERALAALPPTAVWARAFAGNLLGCWHLMRSQLPEAESQLQAALAGFTATGDAGGRSRVLANLGGLHAMGGELAQAERAFAEAVAAAPDASPRLYLNWASVARLQGHLDTAVDCLERGRALASRLGARHDETYLLYELGRVHLAAGRLTDCDRAIAAARIGAEAAGDLTMTRRCHAVAAEAALARTDVAAARHQLLAGRLLPASPLTAETLEFAPTWAAWYLATDELAAAETLITTWIAACDDGGQQTWLAQAWHFRHLLAEKRRQVADSTATAEEARRLAAQVGLGSLRPEAPALDLRPGAGTMPHARATCLGPVSLIGASGDDLLALVPNARAHLVLALLLWKPAGLSRDDLARFVFGDRPVGGSTVATLVHRLRQATADAVAPWGFDSLVVREDRLYRLHPRLVVDGDLHRFEAAVQAAATARTDLERAAAHQQAIAAYGGRLCQDYPGLGALDGERERLHAAWQDACSWLQRWHLAQGRLAAALDLADANLALDPLALPAHRFKLETLLTFGQRGAALAHYEALQGRWRRQRLDVPPDFQAWWRKALAASG